LILESVPPPEGAPSPEELERRLSGYRDFRCIGAGAMGVVYDAYHKPLDRNVAVKVLTTGLAGRAITVKRFYQEARAMAQISHPNIVPVYEVGSEEGFPYFTMELVRGGSLKQLLEREGPLPVRRAAQIALDVAEALLHAHRAGLLHRDVKPGNVLLDENGTSRLTDFGLVRRTDSVTITASDALVGTPQYMSPEQVRGLKLDGRSDQFSLGTTLYEMLAGTPPFQGENPMSVLRAITELEPRSLASFRPDVPTALQAIVMRMMEKDRDRRYLDMEAVRADLARFLRGEAVEATLPGPVSRAWRRLRSNRLAWRFAVATLVIGGGVAAYITINERFAGQARVGQILMEARGELIGGRPEAARRLLDDLPASRKNTVEAILLRADILKQLGEFSSALALYRQAMDLAPARKAEFLFKAADLTLDPAAPDFGAAREIQRQIQAMGLSEPGDLDRLTLFQGDLERRLGTRRIREADEILSSAAAGASADPDFPPRDPRARARLGAASLQFDSARDAYRAFLDRNPEDARTTSKLTFVECMRQRLLALIYGNQEGLWDSWQQLNRYIEQGEPFDIVEVLAVADIMARDLQRAGISPERMKAVQDIQTRYGFMLKAAEGAISAAREEMEKSINSITTPQAMPSSGPLTRMKDAVQGLVGSILGSGGSSKKEKR